MSSQPLLTDPRDQARALVLRFLFATFATVGAGAALLALLSRGVPGPMRLALGLGFVGVTLYSLAALRWPRCGGERGVVALCAIGLALMGATAMANGWGFNTPAMTALAVFTLLIAATVQARLGLLLAAASLLVLLALALAEALGWIPGARALAEMPLLRRLGIHVFLLGLGLAGGLVVTRVFSHYLGSALERERRFSDLLGIAADAYWETDARGRLSGLWLRRGERRFEPQAVPDAAPWELPACSSTPTRCARTAPTWTRGAPSATCRCAWRAATAARATSWSAASRATTRRAASPATGA